MIPPATEENLRCPALLQGVEDLGRTVGHKMLLLLALVQLGQDLRCAPSLPVVHEPADGVIQLIVVAGHRVGRFAHHERIELLGKEFAQRGGMLWLPEQDQPGEVASLPSLGDGVGQFAQERRVLRAVQPLVVRPANRFLKVNRGLSRSIS